MLFDKLHKNNLIRKIFRWIREIYIKLYFKEVGSIFAFSVTTIKIGDQNDEKQKSYKNDVHKR